MITRRSLSILSSLLPNARVLAVLSLHWWYVFVYSYPRSLRLNRSISFPQIKEFEDTFSFGSTNASDAQQQLNQFCTNDNLNKITTCLGCEMAANSSIASADVQTFVNGEFWFPNPPSPPFPSFGWEAYIYAIQPRSRNANKQEFLFKHLTLRRLHQRAPRLISECLVWLESLRLELQHCQSCCEYEIVLSTHDDWSGHCVIFCLVCFLCLYQYLFL
jgi:hypothetical protein